MAVFFLRIKYVCLCSTSQNQVFMSGIMLIVVLIGQLYKCDVFTRNEKYLSYIVLNSHEAYCEFVIQLFEIVTRNFVNFPSQM